MNLRWCIFSVLLLIFSFSGRSQQYNFRNYNVEDGLGQSQVYSILQDERGQLWLGTRGSGISVFDGFEFHSYTSKDGLPSNYINEIVADTSGRIWVATNKGLCFFNGRSFTKLDLGVFDSDLVVRDIFVDTQNNIYCATEFGIYNVDENKAIALNPINGKPINASSIYVDEEKAIWIGTNDGFFVQRKGVLTEFSQESEYMKNSITTVNRDESGTFWIGTYGDGMYCYDGERFYRVDYHLELYRQTVLDIHLDEHQNVWIATLSGGVVHYDKATKTFTSITEKEGLSNNHVRCIVQDNSHNFWFGTSGGGVCHYLGKQFTNYDQRSGLAGNYIYSVLRDKSGKLWIGNSQKGVSVLTNEGFINYDATNEFHNVKVKALGEDNAGSIWLGTDAQGLYVYKNERFEAIDELRRAYVKQIKVDKAGQIWIATAGSGIIKVTDRQGNYIIENGQPKKGLFPIESHPFTLIKMDACGMEPKMMVLAVSIKSGRTFFN